MLLKQARGQASSADRFMYRDKKVVVVMPAYNAARTLRQTYAEVREQGLVDRIILVDDGSRDETVAIARSLEGVQVHVHEVNKGYGGNQKTCYRLALEAGADIVIMIHPDYQVHAEVDTGDGVHHRQRAASVCAGQPDSGRVRFAGGDARLEIRVKSVPDTGGEYSAGGEAV